MQPSVDQILALKPQLPDHIAVQSFDPSYFASLSDELKERLLFCLRSGIANTDSKMGCYAGHARDYDELCGFFQQVLAAHHGTQTTDQHRTDWQLPKTYESDQLDISNFGVPALSTRVRVGRNVAGFPMPAAMSAQDRAGLENALLPIINELIDDPAVGGVYYSLTPDHPNFVDAQKAAQLVEQHLLFKDCSQDPYLAAAGIASDYPVGRGAYVSADTSLCIWIGEEDHLRIMCRKTTTQLGTVLSQLKALLDRLTLGNDLEFMSSPRFGSITSCPTNLGTGMRASVHMKLPNLAGCNGGKKLKDIAKEMGLAVRGFGGEHTPFGEDGTVDVSPSARFCITESEIMQQLYRGIGVLQDAEASIKAGTD